MSEIESFIAARKTRNPKAWAKFDENYRRFAIDMIHAAHPKNPKRSPAASAKRPKILK